jgi:maltoporin
MRHLRAAWAVAALLAYATPAVAVDFFGYFRDGLGTNNKGGGQACFGAGQIGMDYKLRLGNECDNYGEWGLQQSVYKDADGVEFTVGVMFNYDQDVATSNGTAVPFGIQQNYVKAKFPQWAGAQVWAGKQYYRRENVDMIDFFYLNTSDTGFGVEDVDLGFGKLAASVFSVKAPSQWDLAFFRPDVRLYGIAVNPGGTLEVDANLLTISRHSGQAETADEGKTSFWITAEHHQEGILGGWNTAVVQWANGPNAGMGPGTPGFGLNPLNKNNQQFRVLDQLLLQPTMQFQILVGGMLQLKTYGDPAGDQKATQYGIFTRPVFYVSDYFKLQGDLGYQYNKPEHQDALALVKATFAPTLTPKIGSGGGFFVRPEIRLFVTYGGWNDAVATAHPASQNGVDFGSDKSGVAYGMSVETWF